MSQIFEFAIWRKILKLLKVIPNLFTCLVYCHAIMETKVVQLQSKHVLLLSLYWYEFLPLLHKLHEIRLDINMSDNTNDFVLSSVYPILHVLSDI